MSTEAEHLLQDERAALRQLRSLIVARIEADIELLDNLDGDPDLEEDDDAGGDIQDQPHDEEQDSGIEDQPHDGELDEGEADDSDLEPSLGAPENHSTYCFRMVADGVAQSVSANDQTRWAAGGTSDHEHEDEREPEDGQ